MTMLISDIRTRFGRGECNVLIMDDPVPLEWIGDTSYVEESQVFTNPDVFWPVTGCTKRPTSIYVRQDTSESR
jgi:hypothetical protein